MGNLDYAPQHRLEPEPGSNMVQEGGASLKSFNSRSPFSRGYEISQVPQFPQSLTLNILCLVDTSATVGLPTGSHP